MIINENSGSSPHTECNRLLLVRLNARFSLLALDIFFESIDVQPKHSGISVEDYPLVLGLAPNGLFSTEQVVHLPKTALQIRGFGCQCCFTRMQMIPKREVAEDNTQTRTIIALELVNRLREIRTRRTLEVSKFDNCHRRIGASADMTRFSTARSGRRGTFGDCQSRKPLGAIEHRAAHKRS